jgi:methyl-accepting chemotaxis protein
MLVTNTPIFTYNETILGWNWTLLALVNQNELAEESTQILFATGIASVFGVILISLLLAWGLVKTLNPLRKLTNNIDAVAKGNLTHHFEPCNDESLNEVDLISNSVRSMALELKNLIHALQSSVTQLEEQANSSQNLALTNGKEANEMMAQTDQIATAIEEMSFSIKDVANHANEGAQQTKEVDAQTQSGHQQLNNVVNDLMLLSQQLNDSHTSINAVKTASNEINKVIEVINAIAEQTNLLALNAAIEAARAGEQGRGFSVVADEVRTLAQKTQSSISEISQTIEQLQNQVSIATQQMEQSQLLGVNSAKEGEKTGEQLSFITQSIGRLTTSSTNIAHATEQQSSVAAEITQNLHLISQLAKNGEVRTSDSIESSKVLITLAEKIKQQISFFKVN